MLHILSRTILICPKIKSWFYWNCNILLLKFSFSVVNFFISLFLFSSCSSYSLHAYLRLNSESKYFLVSIRYFSFSSSIVASFYSTYCTAFSWLILLVLSSLNISLVKLFSLVIPWAIDYYKVAIVYLFFSIYLKVSSWDSICMLCYF